MRLAILPFLVATAVNAAPFSRRQLSRVISNCKHDFSYSFDDGPYVYHNEILDRFNAANAKTTFFLNGENWSCIYDQANVDAIRRSFEQGHQIASHTWSHASLKSLSEAQIDYEIQRLDEAFVKILGVRPKFLRPPYGAIDDRSAQYIQNKYGKTIVLWSHDSGDSTGGSTDQSYNFYNYFANQGPGRPYMALSHETQDTGIEALRRGTVTRLAGAGIKLQTVSQCLDMEAYEYVGGYGARDESWSCGGDWAPSPNLNSTTSSPPPNPTCVTTYLSVAGDNCVTIESKFGLPAGAIKQANSFVTCNHMWVGTPLCIPPGGSGGQCTRTISSTPGATCDSIGADSGVSGAQIKLWNDFLNCQDIWDNTPVCVAHT